MLNPSDLLSAIVALYNGIPALVAAMTDTGGANINSYDDVYPGASDSSRALVELPSPGMLVRYEGTVGDNTEVRGTYVHDFSVWIRSKGTTIVSTQRYSDIGHLLLNGIPTGGTLMMSRLQIVPGVEPLVFDYYQRRTDQNGLEYFEFRFHLPEIGDQ